DGPVVDDEQTDGACERRLRCCLRRGRGGGTEEEPARRDAQDDPHAPGLTVSFVRTVKPAPSRKVASAARLLMPRHSSAVNAAVYCRASPASRYQARRSFVHTAAPAALRPVTLRRCGVTCSAPMLA